MRKIFLLIVPLFLTSCSWFWHTPENVICPYISIPQDKAYMTQTVNYLDNFQIELIGYEGYCYNEDGLSRRYAVITPVFSVTRLRSSDETDVDFAFYTETIQGPPGFVGKRTYTAGTGIKTDEQSKEFRGKPVKVKIPADGTPLEIILALDVSLEEYHYNHRTFNIEAHHLKADNNAQNHNTSCRSCGI